MTAKAILLRYHEIALKGDNRSLFERQLASNACHLIRRAAGGDFSVRAAFEHGRVVLHCECDRQVREALGFLFGLSSYSPVSPVTTELETIKDTACEQFALLVKERGLPASFRVESRRSDKALSQTSMEIDSLVGSLIKTRFPSVAVNLNAPEVTIGIEVRTGHSYIWTEKFKGRGGLPVGSNGGVLCLISGGLDSPVAAIRTLRRGSPVSFLHFDGAPFVGNEASDKVHDLVRIINRYQPDPKPLYVIPFGKIQEKIALAVSPKLRTVLYRRMMTRIACEFAQKLGLFALITGESLGQVASQTVENIRTINEVAALPVLRPLIGSDKDEIIEQAKAWGTYDISIRPAADCCTLFTDKHPAIKSTPSEAREQESKYDVKAFVEEALSGMETKEASP